jgi:hypothetical protein
MKFRLGSDKNCHRENAYYEKLLVRFESKKTQTPHESNLADKKCPSDIRVVLFPDRVEIEKLNIKIPYSSLCNERRGMIIGCIIQEVSRVTGLHEDEILIIKSE